MYHKNWDSFHCKPGTVISMQCRVCGSDMNVKRDVEGPASFTGALGGFKHIHDHFTCPNSEEGWHEQIIKLKLWIEQCPSKLLADIVEGEIKQIIDTKQRTREANVYDCF